MPSANRNANPIANMIFGDAEGFLPSALTAAYPTVAMIRDGPRVEMNMTKAIVKFRIWFLIFNYDVWFALTANRSPLTDPHSTKMTSSFLRIRANPL